ncbi:MAG: ATP-binding cassette domain-containing protein [Coriobacteriia bacterium]
MSGLSVTLRKRLPGFDLDVGWAVGDGFTVLFGYSGAGKSLTLSMIAGTLRPDEGRVVLGGATLCDTRHRIWVPPQVRRIGYVSQSAQLFPHMTVLGNVEYALGALPRKVRRQRAQELLDRLQVADLANRRPDQLSGGQKQRCALARVLALEPKALLLDEPLSALDLPLRVEMRELLRQVQRDSCIPFIMVTHDLIEACAVADTLVVYSGVGAVQVGTPRELVGDPATPEIRRLLHAMELPEHIFRRNEPEVPITRERKEHVA